MQQQTKMYEQISPKIMIADRIGYANSLGMRGSRAIFSQKQRSKSKHSTTRRHHYANAHTVHTAAERSPVNRRVCLRPRGQGGWMVCLRRGTSRHVQELSHPWRVHINGKNNNTPFSPTAQII